MLMQSQYLAPPIPLPPFLMSYYLAVVVETGSSASTTFFTPYTVDFGRLLFRK